VSRGLGRRRLSSLSGPIEAASERDPTRPSVVTDDGAPDTSIVRINQMASSWARETTVENKKKKKAGRPRGGVGDITLEDALAVYLYYYLQDGDTIGEREERILDAAWEIIERQAKRAIAFSEKGPGQ
jgi:hypothetical protein